MKQLAIIFFVFSHGCSMSVATKHALVEGMIFTTGAAASVATACPLDQVECKRVIQAGGIVALIGGLNAALKIYNDNISTESDPYKKL